METKCTTRSLAEYEVITLRNKVNKIQTQINKLTHFRKYITKSEGLYVRNAHCTSICTVKYNVAL
jgi:hypothetical protein